MGNRGPLILLVGVLALAAGIALGAALAGRRGERVEAPPPAGTGSAVSVGELAPVLRELSRALASLRDELARTPPTRAASSPPVEREPASNDAAVLPSAAQTNGDLASALQALASALRDLGADGRSDGLRPRALVPPRWVDRTAAFADSGLRAASLDEDRYDAALAEFRKRHFFWTAQQVLDGYGKPDSIWIKGEQTIWNYKLISGEQSESYEFYFKEGLVYEVEHSL